jgi:alkylhydroperoxidase family enzyme
MARVTAIGDEALLVGRVLEHRPELKESFVALDASVRYAPTLELRLKEEVRRAVAPQGGCVFCASLGAPTESPPDRRTALAVAFGLAATGLNLWEIDDEMRAVMLTEFTERELIELTGWISLVLTTGQMFGSFSQLEPATQDVIAAYSKWWQPGESDQTAAE